MATRRPKGEGSIYYNDDRGRWEASLTLPPGPNGERRRRRFTGARKADVSKAMKAARSEMDAGQLPPSSTLTVDAYLDRWLKLTLPGTVAPRTEQNYREIKRLYIRPHIGHVKLKDLSPDHVSAMLRALEADGKSPSTQRLARAVLRRALRRAQQEGTLARNVAAIADGPKGGAKPGRTLTPEQARKFLDYIETTDDERIRRSSAAWVVMLSLGLRRGELLGLSWDDLNLDAAPPTLAVNKSLKRIYGEGLSVGETKTAGSKRTVVLPQAVANKLRAHRIRQLEERLHAGELWDPLPLDHDLVFRTPFGSALDPDNLKNMTYTATRASLGEKWSPHEMRHSAASLLIAQNVPLKIIAEVLGHSSIRITADVYGHLFAPSQVAADAMTDTLFGDSS